MGDLDDTSESFNCHRFASPHTYRLFAVSHAPSTCFELTMLQLMVHGIDTSASTLASMYTFIFQLLIFYFFSLLTQ